MRVNRKRILAVLLIGLLAIMIPAFCLGEAVPCYNYTWTVYANLEIDTSGYAEAIGRVTTYEASSTIVLNVTLCQKYGSTWKEVDSWSDTMTGNTTLEVIGTAKLPGAGTYKTAVTGSVTSVDGDTEWFTLESGHGTYP